MQARTEEVIQMMNASTAHVIKAAKKRKRINSGDLTLVEAKAMETQIAYHRWAVVLIDRAMRPLKPLVEAN